MAVARTNVDFAKRILADRVGNPYVYGGCWDPNDTSVGTDCSGLVVHMCDAVRNGTAMTWTRHGMTTESWRPIEVGQTGTVFNTICVASPADFPADAAVKIALHHGPGGGVNSHMWCEVDGMRGESNGTDGCVTGAQAMSVYDTSYANDWHYIPGPIGGTSPPSNRDTYIQAIIAEGQRRGITPRGITIALATALVESNLVMYANAKVPESMTIPHEEVGSDGMSVGLFQQQVISSNGQWWWGDAATCMDPTQSAGLFYDHLAELDYNNTDNTPGYYAQAVQRSAFPDRYDEHYPDAESLYAKLAQPVSSDDGGFLMALTDQQQQDLYNEIMSRRNSRSPLRHVGEGAVGDTSDMVYATDGSVHVLLVSLLARLGDPDSINLLNEVAALDTSRYPDRVHDKNLARALLNDLANARSVGSAPATGTTPGVVAAPVVVAPVAPVPVAAPVAPTPAPTGTGVQSQLNSVGADITALRTALSDLANQARS